MFGTLRSYEGFCADQPQQRPSWLWLQYFPSWRLRKSARGPKRLPFWPKALVTQTMWGNLDISWVHVEVSCSEGLTQWSGSTLDWCHFRKTHTTVEGRYFLSQISKGVLGQRILCFHVLDSFKEDFALRGSEWQTAWCEVLKRQVQWANPEGGFCHHWLVLNTSAWHQCYMVLLLSQILAGKKANGG